MSWKGRAGILLLWLAAFASPLRGALQERSSVILITVDTLRADRLGRGLTPHMDGLARDGILFSNAVTPVPLTLPAHASLLTGLYPVVHGVRDFSGQGLGEQFTTLAEIYRQAGYQTAAFVSAFVLDSLWGLDQGFEVYYDHFEEQLLARIQPGKVERPADQTLDLVLQWLEKESRWPFFLWIHFFDPHSDYRPPEPFGSRFSRQPYDGEVAFVDSQLGRLLAYVAKRQWEDRILWVLTSDHGESLGEHGEQEHGFFLYESTLRVPLIWKVPGAAAGRRIEEVVSLIDVAPTLLQLGGLPRPAEMQGEGLYHLLMGSGRGRNADHRFAETLYPLRSFGWHDLKSLRTTRYKYIEAPQPELYDLDSDPGELHNLVSSHSALAAQFRERLRRGYQEKPSPRPSPPPSLSPEQREKLKALGYISYSSPLQTDRRSLADPKEKIGVFNRILEAMDLAQLERWEESNRLLDEVLSGEPGLLVARHLRAQNFLLLEKPRQAMDDLKQILAARPQWEEAVFSLARAYWQQGDLEGAKTGFRRVLDLNPKNALAHFNLGALLMGTDLAQAELHFKEVLRVQPDFLPALRNLGVALVDQKRFQEAEPYLERAVELGPGDAIAWNYLGIVARNRGALERAVQCYQRALAADPTYAVARLNLAFAQLQQGKASQARDNFRLFCQAEPQLCERYRSAFEGPPER